MTKPFVEASVSESRSNVRIQKGQATDMCDFESRRRLLDLSVGLVEDLCRTGIRPGKGPEGYCTDFQVCLPYRGLFVWHVGHDDVVGDANQVVYCAPEESFRMSGPICEGYAEMIITPDVEVLAEVMRTDRARMVEHPLFRRRSWPVDSRLQAERTRFLYWASAASHLNCLAAEESVLSLLRSAFLDDQRRCTQPGARTARIIRRTKEYLVAELSNTVRLMDVARAVGVSPAYLTDVFRRVEGLPVHRYLNNLRLARALVDLPHTDDLTALALNLGFSSHSHFSYAFRRAFGATPSQFRSRTRTSEAVTTGARAD
jgi:AraC family transcriptional regulator